MNWMQRLYETYDANKHRVGSANDAEPLLPVLHILMPVHIEIILDKDSHFLDAKVVPWEDRKTIVPCTELSMGRSGRMPVNHPLCDKLQYVAGDFTEYGGVVTAGFSEKPSKPFEDFLCGLKEWSESANSSPWIQVVYHYVCGKHLLADLVSRHILHLDSMNRLIPKWDGKNKPEIFGVIGNQQDAAVRWAVQVPGNPLSRLDRDPEVWRSWAEHYRAREGTRRAKVLCAISGSVDLPALFHPKKIVNGGGLANAKLISSDDKKGYTFRGRFEDSQQACAISLDVSQKFHAALTWLVARQGNQNGTQTVVSWAVSGKSVPDPLADTDALLRCIEGTQSEAEPDRQAPGGGDVGQAFARRLSRMIAGYKAKLGPTEDIVVMGMDSAIPGRMAVTFYRELKGSEFLDRIMRWHETFAWFQDLSDSKEGRKRDERKFVGAPSPKKIAEVAGGGRQDDKLSKATVERLLPCIIDGRPIPRDLVECAVRRAVRRFGMKCEAPRGGKGQGEQEWEWEQTLGVACSLFRGFHKERGYAMALEADRRTRDYLYGRLLAIAEHLEGRALYLADESRDTTAARLMQRFADHPFSTWRNIEKGLQPYKSRLQARNAKFLFWISALLDEVHDLFDLKDYEDDRPLTGEFLLAYHCQRRALHEGPAGAAGPDDQKGETNL